MEKRMLYIDNVQVDTLVNSKTTYTWFLLIDGSLKKVLTCDYENTCGRTGAHILASQTN